MTIIRTVLTLTTILLLSSGNTLAEIYEIIDKDGNKTYTNTPPQGPTETPATKVETKETNVWQGGDKQLEANDAFFEELKKQHDDADAAKQEKKRVWKVAQDKLKAAETALEEAKVIKAGDYYPNTNGGIRYKEEYKNRVKTAEDAVKRAQEEFDAVDKKTKSKDKVQPTQK